MIHVHAHPQMSVLLRVGGRTLNELYMFTCTLRPQTVAASLRSSEDA